MRSSTRRASFVLAIAAATVVAGGTAAAAAPVVAATPAVAQHTAAQVAKQPVSRFVAWQACQSAVWKWVAGNAANGTSVGTGFNTYAPSLEWRYQGGWFVQIAGTAHEKTTANNGSSFCVVKGTNAHPKIVGYTYPR